MSCNICAHYKRAEIENAILNMSPENTELTLESIAKDYNVQLNELKIHALMHTQIVTGTPGEQTSIARQLKLKEADILASVVTEYMVTLKSIGRRINALTYQENFEQLLSKPVVELYLGTGGEIRSTVKTLAELNGILNGPEMTNAGGLHALAAAIAMSKGAPSEEV